MLLLPAPGVGGLKFPSLEGVPFSLSGVSLLISPPLSSFSLSWHGNNNADEELRNWSNSSSIRPGRERDRKYATSSRSNSRDAVTHLISPLQENTERVCVFKAAFLHGSQQLARRRRRGEEFAIYVLLLDGGPQMAPALSAPTFEIEWDSRASPFSKRSISYVGWAGPRRNCARRKRMDIGHARTSYTNKVFQALIKLINVRASVNHFVPLIPVCPTSKHHTQLVIIAIDRFSV